MSNSLIKLCLPTGSSYDIRIGADITSELGKYVAEVTQHRTCALISDTNVAPLYSKQVANALENAGFAVAQFAIEAGEKSKNLHEFETLHRMLSEYRFARDSVVVALGGGVVGDLAGFVASTYMRGLPFVQVPTSLLAMVDSSVGGKNGVDVAGVKNLVGNFAQPIYVSADISLLETLPQLEWKCGFAEMAKSAIIDSAEFASWMFEQAPLLVQHDGDAVRQAIAKTVEFKARVVVDDEHESNKRKCLNYGHTLGHAIEALADKPKVLHGIAVAEGMRFAASLSDEVLGVTPGFIDAQDQLLTALGIEPMARIFDADKLVELMLHDKKANGQSISFVLATAPGKWEVCDLQPEFVRAHLRKWMNAKGV